MKYNYYKTDGTKEVIESATPLGLEKLQELVGGYIELVPLNNGNYLFVNEEGYLKDLPRNPHFTQDDTPNDLSHSQGRFCGNVIEERNDREGEFIGVE